MKIFLESLLGIDWGIWAGIMDGKTFAVRLDHKDCLKITKLQIKYLS